MARRRRRLLNPSRNARKTTTPKRNRSSGLRWQVKDNIAREVWGVLYLGLAAFTFLSFQKNFGVIGEAWINFIQPILGWGASLVPLVFLGLSLHSFFGKNIKLSFSRVVGLMLFAVSLLSIFHLYVPLESLRVEAQRGAYGGYVGFVSNFIFQEIFNIGRIGATVVFVTTLLIGFLLTFQISLSSIFQLFKPSLQKLRRVSKSTKTLPKNEEDIDIEESDEEEETGIENNEENESNDTIDSPESITIKRPEIVMEENENRSPTPEPPPVTALQTSDYDYVWEPPSLDLLHPPVPEIAIDDHLLKENARKIYNKLKQFGIMVEMHEVHVGPTVIQYTLRPSEGIKLSKITSLKNDLALALAAKAIRIEAPIPGKSLVGIEVPNDHRTTVHLRELLEHAEFQQSKSSLRLPLGRDVAGKPIYDDLETMPHLLVAGATGSGKSVGMNSFLMALLYQNSPADLRLIMIDPKRVELGMYNGIPHLLTPVITDPEKATLALRWAVAEMNRRYQLLSEHNFRNISEFNQAVDEQMVAATTTSEETENQTNSSHTQDAENRISTEHTNDEPETKFLHINDNIEVKIPQQKLPNIVVVIDELADLMMAAGKEVEASICRLAQMARAVGIHLIVATQRPSVDVITGLIKANIPTRIAFAVTSAVDSRTILDATGAEDLLGRGDMLYLPSGMSKPIRVQGILTTREEVERVTTYLKMLAPPDYVDEIISSRLAQERIQGIPESQFSEGGDDDDLYQQALQLVLENRKASASLLQRRLKVGYARAARLLDLMEENGVIGPVRGAKPREILVE